MNYDSKINLFKPIDSVEYINRIAHIRAFAQFMYSDMRENGRILLRIQRKGHAFTKIVWANSIDEFVKICDQNYYQYTIYAGVSYRSKDIDYDRDTGKDSCTGTSVLWADIDIGSTGHKKENYHQTLEEAIDYILKSELNPDMWVYTGGGYHLYWKLDKRADFPDDIKKVEECNKGIAAHLHGDAVHDISRIMRVPGTLNFKYGENGLQTSIVFPKPNNEGESNHG